MGPVKALPGVAEATGASGRLASQALLDGVVAELRDIERRNGIERTLAIGEIIIERFFSGNPAAWRDRRRNKNNSVRRLADRKDCPFCKSALNEAVAVYVASLGLPCVRTFGHIGASHVAAVLRLPPAQREELLSRAERENLSVRELRRKVVSIRRAEGERRGRPSRDDQARLLSLLRGGVLKVREGVDRISADADLRAGSRVVLAEVAEMLAELHSELRALAGTESTAPALRQTVRTTEERGARSA
jgi:hypothetical protein